MGELTGVIYDAERRPTRKCGDCQLCCKLLPTKELNKVANTRCQHQRVGKGCMIYARRPFSCAVWNCRWLINDDADELHRPDRSHYVIDIMPDFVTMQFDDGRPSEQIMVLQVWVDPKYPDAHRDPALRAYLDRNRAPALIRYGSDAGFTIFPPSVAADHQWHEERSRQRIIDREHTSREIAAASMPALAVTLSEDRPDATPALMVTYAPTKVA